MNIYEYECPDCHATRDSKPYECCDTCILRFYLEEVEAPTLLELHNPSIRAYVLGYLVEEGK